MLDSWGVPKSKNIQKHCSPQEVSMLVQGEKHMTPIQTMQGEIQTMQGVMLMFIPSKKLLT